MEGTNGNQNGGQKPTGLSWSQPNPGASNTPPLMPQSKPAQTAPAVQPPKQNTPPAQPKQQSAPAMKKVSPDSGAGSSKRIGMIAGGIVVVGLIVIAWLMWGGQKAAPGTVATTTTTGTVATGTKPDMTGVPGNTTTTTTTSGSSALTVASPQASGLSVAITSANVSVPTWVVVYESFNGKPGRALGATLFFPENNGKGGTVTLLRATTSGQSYLIGENIDSGSHIFSLHSDQAVVDQNGSPVWYSFNTN